jgi:hypothetical protein
MAGKRKLKAILRLSMALYRNARQHVADDQNVEMHVAVPVSILMGLCTGWTRWLQRSRSSDENGVIRLSDRRVDFPELSLKRSCVDNFACFMAAKLSLSVQKFHATHFNMNNTRPQEILKRQRTGRGLRKTGKG